MVPGHASENRTVWSIFDTQYVYTSSGLAQRRQNLQLVEVKSKGSYIPTVHSFSYVQGTNRHQHNQNKGERQRTMRRTATPETRRVLEILYRLGTMKISFWS